MKRFAVIGAGFWSQFQVAAWQELGRAQCVAVCDTDAAKAAQLASTCQAARDYTDPEKLLAEEQLDFVDIITPPSTHRPLVELVARHGVDVICQKPLAESLADAESMVNGCRAAGVKLLVHENFRWQTPIRALKRVLEGGAIGNVFRARLHFCSSFPVFDNQPLLAQLEQFLLTDVGVHILDVARFLFGDAQSLYCLTQRVNPSIRGEDVVTVVLKMKSGATVVNEISYASRLKDEAFPQTYAVVEGADGCAELGKDFWLHVTTEAGTESNQHPPPRYSWADPAYDVAHSSLVPCNENLLQGLGGGQAETTGEDNLKTLRLVYGSYESARANQVMEI